MAKKKVGYVELEWICKRCKTKNPGTQKTCSGCGAPMETVDEFELPEQQKLVTDQAKIDRAQKGADIHCPYCGTRNPAGTEICTQCNGDLREGKVRHKGRLLGALADKPVADKSCPNCGVLNPVSAQSCTKCGGPLVETKAPTQPPAKGSSTKLIVILGGVLGFICLCIAGIIWFSSRTNDVTGVVSAVEWQRTVAILEIQSVEHEDWYDSVPSSAEVLSCEWEYRETVSEWVPGAEEVCGTPYTVDDGSGLGSVYQDCEYRIYDEWCRYTAEEWAVVDDITASGTDLSPYWPNFTLDSYQQEGDSTETFEIHFRADGKTYTYHPQDESEFGLYEVGSEWLIEVDGFGNIKDVSPR